MKDLIILKEHPASQSLSRDNVVMTEEEETFNLTLSYSEFSSFMLRRHPLSFILRWRSI